MVNSVLKRATLLLLLLVSGWHLYAQTDHATLTGTITDPGGSRVSNATLSITSDDTGAERVTKTNGSGVYTLSALPVGYYTGTLSAAGFETIQIQQFQLNVGQTRTLDLQMKVANVSTEVEVLSAGSGLSQSSADIGGVAQESQIQEIPLNGRNWVSLIALTPGVIDSGTGTEDQVRFAGLSQEDNTFHLDGVDMSGINHAFNKNNLRMQVSTEAIAEFRANSAAYSAEQGGSPGGQMELVSRSGGEQFHGAAWEFLRNNIFDAAPWGATSLPALRLNNFGANLGGPILKSKLFFFANWEALRQYINQPLNGYVPNATFRAEVMAKSPQLAPILNAFPIGTVPVAGSTTASEWFGSSKQTQTENSGLMRVDYRLSDRTALSFRFNTDYGQFISPYDSLGETGYVNMITPNAIIDLQHTFSPRLSNDFKFGFNRDNYEAGQTTYLPIAVSVSGFTALGNPSGSVRRDNSFSTVDDATYVTGRHTIKAGVQIRRIQENKASPSSPNQTISFTSTNDFLNDLIDTDSYAGTVPMTGQRMTEEFGYILDEYQVRPNLTFNVGLRYEYYGVDHEVEGRGILVDPLSCPTVTCPVGTSWYYPNLLDFEPRISAMWSPGASGKTVIRSGFGMYDGNGQFGNLGMPVGNITSASYSLTQQQAPGLSYPLGAYTGAITNSYSPAASPRNRKDIVVDEWTLSAQREIAPATIAQVAYFGTSASHVFSDWTLNGINPATGTRPYAGYSTLDYRGTFNHASTNALQAGLQRSMSGGLLLTANYEYSHSIDNGGIGGGEADIPQDLACLRCERSSSDQDMRHYFGASAIWKLPVGRNHADG
jgi:hypothetical protein